jgi:transcription termination factor 2
MGPRAVLNVVMEIKIPILLRESNPRTPEDVSWRKVHNDELHNLYSSPHIVGVIKSRRMRWAGHVARMEEGRGVYRVFVGRLEGKRPLGRPRRRWENNIKMDLREIGIDGANWIRLDEDRAQWRAFVNTVIDFRVP